MKYCTGGDSHGSEITVVVQDVPAGLELTPEMFETALAARRTGYGRSVRQQDETDTVRVSGGLRFGHTTGAPLVLSVGNAAAAVTEADPFAPAPTDYVPQTVPRPGHAELCGLQKYCLTDCRDVAERASARETVGRVAAGAVAQALLARLGVEVRSCVTGVGGVQINDSVERLAAVDWAAVEADPLRCPDAAASAAMRVAVDAAAAAGTTVGGTFCVVTTGLVPGLGGYARGADRLTARLGAAVLGVPAVHAVEFGLGFEAARQTGARAIDPYVWGPAGPERISNNAGGLEGGMTTGQPLVIRGAMKPVPTQAAALASVDLATGKAAPSPAPRYDTCAVPAAAVTAAAEVALALTEAYREKFGGDCVEDLVCAVEAYRRRLAGARA